MSCRALSLLLVQSLFLWSLTAMSAWADWWQTPEQKAMEALKNGDSETLLNVAPNDDWRGVGEFETGDYGAAAKTFADTASDHALRGDHQAENDALYNQGVSQVRNGQYQEAIDNFNTVIDRDSDYLDAEHNRAIAEQLLQLQQQQQQQQSGSDDNENPSQNQQQSSDEGEQQQDESSSQSESSESQDSPSEEEQSSSDSDQDEDGEPSPNGDEQDQRDAEQALDAEARSDEDTAQQGEQDIETETIESPMSEADQAAEQLLRRIPDDPAGLLRRKLEQSHRSEYPEVGNVRQPW